MLEQIKRRRDLDYFLRNQEKAGHLRYKPYSGYHEGNHNERSNRQHSRVKENNVRNSDGLLPSIYDQQQIKADTIQESINKYKEEDDKTEVYLQNCEKIIKNLRVLKHKRKMVGNRRNSTDHPINNGFIRSTQSLDMSKIQSNNGFSSQGTPYNKLLPPLYDKEGRRSKMVGSSFKSSENSQYQRPKRFSTRVRTLPSKERNHEEKNIDPGFQQERYVNLPVEESRTPLGLGEQQKTSYLREIQNKNIDISPILSNNQSRIKEHRPQDKQHRDKLYECISELTKFLKKQNQNKQVEKESKTSRISKRSKQQYQKQTLIPIQANINPQEIKPTTNKSHQKQNVKELQGNTIDALRQLESIDQRPETNCGKVEQKPLQNKIAPLNIDELSDLSQTRQDLLNFNGASKTKSSKFNNTFNNKQRSSSQMKISQQFSLGPNGRQIVSQRQGRGDNKNGQMMDLLTYHLEKQDSKNEELSYCLKELTEYLRYQNDEIDNINDHLEKQQQKGVKIILIKQEEKEEEQKQQSKIEQSQKEKEVVKVSINQIIPNMEADHTLNQIEQMDQKEQRQQKEKEISNKDPQNLRQSIIKNLKKARLRGSLFSQKLSTFKKHHPKVRKFFMQRQGNESYQSQKIDQIDPRHKSNSMTMQTQNNTQIN